MRVFNHSKVVYFKYHFMPHLLRFVTAEIAHAELRVREVPFRWAVELRLELCLDSLQVRFLGEADRLGRPHTGPANAIEQQT